jgi:DNA-binding MarR family transcriptional regulator
MAAAAHRRPTSSKQARREAFIPVMRELAQAYQAFVRFDAERIRPSGLTPPQADVIFTLGNTEGMTFKELGERTLITKGTLTGVVDRLEDKGLVRREPSADDRRCTIAVLTPDGERVFEEVYTRQIGDLKQRFGRLSRRELDETGRVLRRLRELF